MTYEKTGELELDLNRDVLEGWENYSRLNVEILNMARELGHVLPRIDVVKFGEIYRIRFGRRDDFLEVENYGGHSRAIVALRRREPLPCSIYESHRDDPCLSEKPVLYRPIKDLGPTASIYSCNFERLKQNLFFLPEDLRIKFMEKYNLVLFEEVLMTRYNFENRGFDDPI